LVEPVVFEQKTNNTSILLTTEKFDPEAMVNQTEITTEMNEDDDATHNKTLITDTTVRPETVCARSFLSAFFNKNPHDELFASGFFPAKKPKHSSRDVYLLGAPHVFQVRRERETNDGIVLDAVPKAENVIVTVPYKNRPIFSNLSDEAFEKLGDQVRPEMKQKSNNSMHLYFLDFWYTGCDSSV
jgi:hypothetical protein